MVAEAGAGGDEVEDLHDLRAEAAGETGVAADGVLASDAALLVCGCAERQVGDAEKAVVGDDAVTCGEHVGQAGAHVLVDDDCAARAGGGAGVGQQARCSGRTPTTTRTRSACRANGSPLWVPVTVRRAVRSRVMASTRGVR